jgi:hypothetical protein
MQSRKNAAHRSGIALILNWKPERALQLPQLPTLTLHRKSQSTILQVKSEARVHKKGEP